MSDSQIIKPIKFSIKNKQKAFLELINQKIERYNILVQNPKKDNVGEALLLLQEIEYSAHFLMNHSKKTLSGPGRNWYLTSGIAQQPGRFVQRIAQDLAANVQVKNDAVDFEQLFSEAESAGVNEKAIEALKAKLNSEPYQNSTTNIKNHEILQQLRNALLYAAMTSIYKKPGPLQSLLNVVNNHIYTAIQAEPKLQEQYLLQQQYSGYFDAFSSPEKKEDALEFMRALNMVETHLLNASDEKIIEFYRNNPNRGIIAQKDEDFGKDDDNAASAKGKKISIADLKATWVANGILTTEQLKALAPDFLNKNDLKFLAAGNNITLTLTNKETGENLILRASKQKLENLDCIDTLKNTPAGEYFAAEYATIVGAINEGNRMEDYTLNIIEHCSKGNLQHVRKSISSENTVLIQQQASHLLSQLTDFCARLTDERAYLTDIKLSNFLVKEDGAGNYQLRVSDLKSLRVCAEGAYVHSLSRDDVSGDITPEYAPPEWDEFKKDARFDMDKFMSYQIGLSLYDFLTSLTITSGDENRAKAFAKLKAFKESGEFDYTAAVFKGVEGQVLRELCVAMLKINPKERMSVKEAVAKLDALNLYGPKAELLQDLHEAAYLRSQSMLQHAAERYKAHNEEFNSDPEFLKNYQAMQTFLSEITEAKMATQDTGFFAQALEAEALRLDAWLQQATSQPQKTDHFHPHYAKSLLSEGFRAHLLSSNHKINQLSITTAGSDHAAEKNALLQQVTTIRHSLDARMSHFLSVHRSDIVVTPIVEFSKIFATASALETYVDVLKSHLSDLQESDLELMQERLVALTESVPAEELAQNLRKEALYLQYSVSYAKKDEKQGIPPYLRALRQSLIYNYLENNPNATTHLSEDLDQHLAALFKIDHAQRYEHEIYNEKYPEAYKEALESNKQIMEIYTKLLGDDDDDPIVAQMTQLRVEMKEAYKGGIVSAQGSAETLHKVNLELVNSISYLAGPKLSPFKPVHKEEEWEQLRRDNVDIASPKKKWAHRVLMGVGMSLGLVLVVGTGGIAAAPVLAASIASAVSPTIKDSAVGLITVSSIAARAKRVMCSSKKENQNADCIFNTAAGIADKIVQSSNPIISPNKPAAPHILTADHGGLFHPAGHTAPQKKDKDEDSEGRTDSGGHIDPRKGGG